MSILTSGALRHLYKEARDNIEHKSSAFWQHYLKHEFPDPRTYIVTCESPPDDSRRRVDIVVKRFDVDNETSTALLWVECKKPGGSVRDVEEQALDACRRCVARDDLLFIYTMTTVGTSFRVWFYENTAKKLRAFHGLSTVADRSQYIDADSGGAWVLPQCLELVRNQIPLRDAPTVPSQSLAGLYDAGPSQQQGAPGLDPYYDPGEPSSSSWSRQKSASPSSRSRQKSASPMEEDPVPGPSRPRQKSASPPMPEVPLPQGPELQWVNVHRQRHRFGENEYFFNDTKGKRRKTFRSDWSQIKVDGQKYWAFHGGKNVYVSDIVID